jgi:Na+/serine symporter
MKLLMLLPNLVLIAISGLNISNELETSGVKNLAVMVLHASVLIMCLVFVALIVKSMFAVVEVEVTEDSYQASEQGELQPNMS